MKRKLRYGMVGGGRDAFIGAVHRLAANLDGQIELVAGCFSSDATKSKLSGEDLFYGIQLSELCITLDTATEPSVLTNSDVPQPPVPRRGI